MSGPDATPGTDLRGLVDALYSARWPSGDAVDSIGPGSMPHLTAAILSSDWLAERDRRVRQEAEAIALREAANDLERRAGDFKHLPGDKDTRRAHNEIAGWLRARSRHIKRREQP